MPSKDKRKLAAIMFADVVGYSRMMASNEEHTLELLKDFENICCHFYFNICFSDSHRFDITNPL